MLGELLSALGVGGSVMTAAMLAMVALYLVRAMRLGQSAGAAIGTAGMYTVVVLVVIAVAVGLGWINPNVGDILSDLTGAGAWLWDFAMGPFRRVLEAALDHF